MKVVNLLLALLIFAGTLIAAVVSAQPVPAGHAWRTDEEQRTIDVYKRVNRAVVFITTVTLTVDPFDINFSVRPQEGSGSGVIVDAQRGIILTNLHVIQNAHQISITMADGKSFAAQLVGLDKEYDIAVIKFAEPPSDLVAVPFGNSSTVEVGQRVLAIGNPFGLDRTLTRGIISSLDRTVRSPSGALMREMLQTDAAINPGNSGGPLLDGDGNLIGINTAIVSQSGDSAGIGFAVPINHVTRILPELIATGKVLRPYMGWVLVDTTHGVMVRRVIAGSPAARAGLGPIERLVSNVFVKGFIRDYERADLIVSINKKAVQTREMVEDVINSSPRGEEVELVVKRGGLRGPERTVTITPELR